MNIKPYHTVLMPIIVPTGDHCWDGRRVCDYFDNEGGSPRCDLGLGSLKYHSETGEVSKPPKCIELDVEE